MQQSTSEKLLKKSHGRTRAVQSRLGLRFPNCLSKARTRELALMEQALYCDGHGQTVSQNLLRVKRDKCTQHHLAASGHTYIRLIHRDSRGNTWYMKVSCNWNKQYSKTVAIYYVCTSLYHITLVIWSKTLWCYDTKNQIRVDLLDAVESRQNHLWEYTHFERRLFYKAKGLWSMSR